MNTLKDQNENNGDDFVDPDDEIQPEVFNIWDDLKEQSKEWYFFLFIIVAMVVSIWTHKYQLFSMQVAFIVACISAITNDSVQTIGTFIASTTHFKWYYMWVYLTLIFIGTVLYSQIEYDKDLSFERLRSKGYDQDPTEFSYVQASSPFLLLLLTKIRAPVSTTFLLLGTFSQKQTAFEGVLIKSFQGFGIAFGIAIVFYILPQRFIDKWAHHQRENATWIVIQFLVSGLLWSTWLQQDMSNIAVYLKRSVPVQDMILFLVVITILLAYLTQMRGDKIQRVINSKVRMHNIPECCFIDAIYCFVLFYFKIQSKVPMSTTWVFLGLIGGREIGIAVENKAGEEFTLWRAIKTMTQDTFVAGLGLMVSLAVVWLDQGFKLS